MKGVQKHNLTHQLTHNLGVSIVKGDYGVGHRLPSEAQLCDNFDVSRSATREAVKMLSAKGLISSRPKQGIQVLPESEWNMFDTDVLSWILNSKPSLSLLKEFTQVRVALEPQASALAASNANYKQIDAIEAALERMEDAHEGLDDPLEADIAFHTSVLEATGNRFFVQFKDFISTALRVSTRYSNKIKGIPGTDVQKRRDVFEAIKSGNSELSEKVVRTILDETLELIESKLAINN